MRAVSTAEQTALAGRVVKARNFVWLAPKNRSTGVPTPGGLWDDAGTFSAQVIDPESGTTVIRSYAGAGAMLGLGDIPLTSDLTVKTITFELSQIDATVAEMVRTLDPKLARVEIHRGLFVPTNWQLVSPARCRFIGVVDEIDIVDPRDGEAGRITVRAVSQLREATRSNPATGSDEDQKTRLSTDRFFKHAGVVSEWDVPWGQKALRVGRKEKR